MPERNISAQAVAGAAIWLGLAGPVRIADGAGRPYNFAVLFHCIVSNVERQSGAEGLVLPGSFRRERLYRHGQRWLSVRCCLFLFLTVAVALSGIAHASPARTGPSPVHAAMAGSHDKQDGPCAPGHAGKAHGQDCKIASSCQLCLPLAVAISPMPRIAGIAGSIHSSPIFGREPPPVSRPPKPSTDA
ncbi:hypothetical protein [Dongia sp.]|uniref:hypothetical protein n=1 Tax=Dongia sp. TaxID=1977262 RepID=UPI0035B0F260